MQLLYEKHSETIYIKHTSKATCEHASNKESHKLLQDQLVKIKNFLKIYWACVHFHCVHHYCVHCCCQLHYKV